jgi:DNA-binding response OmpR family regulator
MAHEIKEILVVDDSATIQRLVGVTLKMKGYHVTSAYDGQQGWELLKKNHYDLAILDVVMPKLDGFELTRHIKQDPQLKATPIIMLTVEGDEESREKGKRAGVNSYIVKPFQPEELILKVARRLA